MAPGLGSVSHIRLGMKQWHCTYGVTEDLGRACWPQFGRETHYTSPWKCEGGHWVDPSSARMAPSCTHYRSPPKCHSTGWSAQYWKLRRDRGWHGRGRCPSAWGHYWSPRVPGRRWWPHSVPLTKYRNYSAPPGGSRCWWSWSVRSNWSGCWKGVRYRSFSAGAKISDPPARYYTTSTIPPSPGSPSSAWNGSRSRSSARIRSSRRWAAWRQEYAHQSARAAEAHRFKDVLDGKEEHFFGFGIFDLLHGAHPLLVQFLRFDGLGDVHEIGLLLLLPLRVEGLGLQPHHAQPLMLILVLLRLLLRRTASHVII